MHSRKLIFAIAIAAISSIAFFMGKLDATEWENIIKWTMGGYMVGNVGEHVAKNIHK